MRFIGLIHHLKISGTVWVRVSAFSPLEILFRVHNNLSERDFVVGVSYLKDLDENDIVQNWEPKFTAVTDPQYETSSYLVSRLKRYTVGSR